MIRLRLLPLVLLLVLLIGAAPAGCSPTVPAASPPTVSPSPPPMPTATSRPTRPPAPTPTPRPTRTPAPSLLPIPLETERPPATKPPATATDLLPTLPYTPTGESGIGRIAGRLYYPSDFIPPLVVQAISLDRSRTYRVETEIVPPGRPSYEIVGVEPGIYHVYAYPAEQPDGLTGGYTYLAACHAGHIPVPVGEKGCWRDDFHEPAPVPVRGGYLVGEVDIYDWYAPLP